ncbi:MAG TPA: ferritin-like domain-containing protein, partial [Gaiellaceae bacterium]|nr:ferritin-like domain-containing protein [Gaiellaceae bacterium]
RAFIKTAVAFEDLTAALLKWQAPRLDSREIVAAAVTLHSVETRHAAWIRKLVGLEPATTAFDKPASQAKMAQLIASTHFVSKKPKMSRKARPSFTG